MSSLDILTKKLFNVFKLGGFVVRREFCSYVVQKLYEENIQLENKNIFESCVKNLCSTLEKQCLADKSIEKEHITRAVDVYLHAGYDKHETVFNVINAFDFPKLVYDLDRKLYLPASKKSKFLSDGNTKSKLFNDRYNTILQRTLRNFKNKILENEQDELSLQTIDYLLTVTHMTLNRKLILGCLFQECDGKYCLEDPTGMVQLDLTHAKYHGGFFVENGFVLVSGYYEDKILRVSSMVLPPGEEYKDSRMSFGNINYFGGNSTTPLRDSLKLQEYLQRNPHDTILFFSDVWLDHPMIFEKLEVLFEGVQSSPPAAVVFMGNFVSESHGLENIETLKKLFKQLGELISHYPSLLTSHFVFVPCISDPCTPHIVPRLPLPSYVTEDLAKFVPKAIFATNPCRIQYCNKEIVLFRADILAKLMQSTLHKPQKQEISESVTRTILSQGHLSPISLNALTVHWDFDYTLLLFPLPHLVVIGDKSEPYEDKYKNCQVVNPGSFCEGFQFKCYTPYTDTLDDCVL